VCNPPKSLSCEIKHGSQNGCNDAHASISLKVIGISTVAISWLNATFDFTTGFFGAASFFQSFCIDNHFSVLLLQTPYPAYGTLVCFLMTKYALNYLK